MGLTFKPDWKTAKPSYVAKFGEYQAFLDSMTEADIRNAIHGACGRFPPGIDAWMQGEPLEMRMRRPDQVPYLVGRLPEGILKPGETVSLLLWVPREATKRKTWDLRLDPGGRVAPAVDTGRRLNRFFRLSARFTF